jgi:MoxR-like ATPase
VLIDELDKAPRDTPNDMLNEIERLGFDIPELGVRVEVPSEPKTRPLTVITSNSEKSLPEPFLRRCIYFDIPFPIDDLRSIVLAQAKWLAQGGLLLDEALSLFKLLRDRTRVQRAPGTAELLAWMDTLAHEGLLPKHSLRTALQKSIAAPTELPLLESTFAVLVKKTEDRSAASDIVRAWIDAPP